jgi:hypothetical protein
VEPLTRGLPPQDPRSLCPLFSTEFVDPLEKNPGYATGAAVCHLEVLEDLNILHCELLMAGQNRFYHT